MNTQGLPLRRIDAPLTRSNRRVLSRVPTTAKRSLAGVVFTQRFPSRQSLIVHTYPEPETEKERSPLDYPQEWVTPQPSRRPDIFPEFEKLDAPLPKPLPGDPEQPDEEEEIEKDKEKPKPEPEEDPDKDPEKDPDETELPDA